MMREIDATLNPCSMRIGTCTPVENEPTASHNAVSSRTARHAGKTVLFVLALLLLMVVPCQLLAQNVGSIFGDVLDAQGYAVPGAKVTVVSQERGVTRTVTSNDSGQFSIPSLPVGTYDITVEMAKFVKFERKGIPLDADSNVKVACTLQVAGAEPVKVEVTDTAAGVSDINLQSATVGQLIAPNIVQDIPLIDRSIVGVAQTLPGVTDVSAPASFTGDSKGPTFSTSGSRLAANLFLFDGLVYNNLYRNTGMNYPPPEAVNEVSVLLNNFSSEYGRNAGAVFNVISKSGTNELHGSIWDYFRNDALNAYNWYDKYVAFRPGGNQNPGKDKVIQNQFGGGVGGPIIKNKLFFFAAYQGYRFRNTIGNNAVTPTAAELTGDFSDWYNNGVANGTIDPAKNTIDHWLKNPVAPSNANADAMKAILSQPCKSALDALEIIAENAATPNPGYLPGAKLPTVCMDKFVHNLAMKYLPLNPVAGGVVTTVGPAPKSDDNGFVRVDYNLGKHTINGKVSIINADDYVPWTKSNAVSSYEPMANWARSKFYAGEDTWQLSPTVLNTVRIGYRNFTSYNYPTDHTTAADLGMNFPVFGNNPDALSLPTITVGSVLALGDKSANWGYAINKTFEVNDAITWTKGKHTFQFGASYLRLQYKNFNYGDNQGYFHSSTAGTGQALADFLIGSLNGSSAVEFATGPMNQAGISNNIFGYAKDDWRVLPRLSLSLGLRYELPFAWYEPDNYWGTFAPGVQSTIYPQAPVGMLFPGDPGVPRSIIATPKKEFQPRVGFSYDMFGDGKHALRGGFGMFYNATNANVIQNGNPPWRCLYKHNIVANATNPLTGLEYGECDPENPIFVGSPSMNYIKSDFKPSYAMSYNLGIQNQLPSHITLEITYVGKLGRHELLSYESNPALYVPFQSNANNTEQRRMYYGFGDNIAIASYGSSNYNGLQAMVSRRMAKSLTLNGSYTWSRSIDINSAEYKGVLSESATIPYVFDLSTEKGPSDFNTTHILNAAWVYDLPKTKLENRFLNTLANGWSWGGLYSYQSGKPINITVGSDYAMTGTANQRPVLMGDWHLPSGRSRVDQVTAWFNNTQCTQPPEGATAPTPCPGGAFEKAPIGQWGNLSRNAVIGPPTTIANMYIKRNIKVKEGWNLSIKMDAYGVFNHPNLGKPNGGMGGTWGQITQTTGERQIQLSLKLKF